MIHFVLFRNIFMYHDMIFGGVFKRKITHPFHGNLTWCREVLFKSNFLRVIHHFPEDDQIILDNAATHYSELLLPEIHYACLCHLSLSECFRSPYGYKPFLKKLNKQYTLNSIMTVWFLQRLANVFWVSDDTLRHSYLVTHLLLALEKYLAVRLFFLSC